MKRKIVSLFLSAAIMLAVKPVNVAAYGVDPVYFSDIPANMWYYTAVTSLAEWGMVHGMPDGTFSPQSTVTRAQFLAMLAGASKQTIGGNGFQKTFSDVSSSSWYADYVAWGTKEKIIGGMSDDLFAPNDPITRQQMASILCSFNKNVMGKLLPSRKSYGFKDEDSISSWAAPEVEAAVKAGLMSGYGDGTFRPQRKATRAEAAQIIYSYLTVYESFEQGCAIDEFRNIAHAGGSVDDLYLSSNSLEALNESAAYGNRIVEIDFCWTTDNQLVCLHNWGGDFPEQCTLAEFMKTKIYDVLTPLSLETLAQWLREHPDVRMIPDFKERNMEGLRRIATEYPDLIQRFIPYAFQLSQVSEIREIGYKNVILMLYQMGEAARNKVTENLAFAKENNVTALGLGSSLIALEYCEAGRGTNIPILLFTINDAEVTQQLAAAGADGFFSDCHVSQITW